MIKIEGSESVATQAEVDAAVRDLELDIPEDERTDTENSPVTGAEMKQAVEDLYAPEHETPVIERPEDRAEKIEDLRKELINEDESDPITSSGGNNEDGGDVSAKNLFEDDGKPLVIHNVPYPKIPDLIKEVFGTEIGRAHV